MGINRVWKEKYIDLKDDEVKQYLTYELMSAPTLLRTYGEHSIVEYSQYINRAPLEDCGDVIVKTEGLSKEEK